MNPGPSPQASSVSPRSLTATVAFFRRNAASPGGDTGSSSCSMSAKYTCPSVSHATSVPSGPALSVVVGWATLFGAVILVSYAVLLFVFFSLFIRFYEEPRLAREFGSDYAAYVSQVARWLPWRLDRKVT